MALRFTESKEDSNIFFKIEGGRRVMLLLYVNDLFLTEKVERRRLAAEFEIKDLGMVLSRHGSVVECIWNPPWTREVCSVDPKEVRDDGLQGHEHNYGI